MRSRTSSASARRRAPAWRRRTAQGRLIASTPNLLLAYEHHLEQERDIQNWPEDGRRTQRTSEALEQALEAERALTTLVCASRSATQCCLMFSRWLGAALRDRLPVIPLHAHRSAGPLNDGRPLLP